MMHKGGHLFEAVGELGTNFFAAGEGSRWVSVLLSSLFFSLFLLCIVNVFKVSHPFRGYVL